MAGEILRALEGLSNTIRAGFGDLSSSQLENKKLDLVGARQEADFRLEEEKRNDPRTRLAQTEATNELEFLQAPAHIRDLAQGADSANLIEQFAAETIPAQLKALGATMAKDGSGSIVKEDGTPLTNQDLINNSATLAGIRLGTTSITKTIETKLADPNLSPEEKEQWEDLKSNPHKAQELKMNMIANVMAQQGERMSPAAKELLNLRFKDAQEKWRFHASKVLSPDERKQMDLNISKVKAQIAAVAAGEQRAIRAEKRAEVQAGRQAEAAADTKDLRKLQKEVELAKIKAAKSGGRMQTADRVKAMKLAADLAQPIIDLKFNKDPKTGELTEKTTGDPVSAEILAQVQQQEIANQFQEITGEADVKRNLKDLSNLFEKAFGKGTAERSTPGQNIPQLSTGDQIPETGRSTPDVTAGATTGQGLLNVPAVTSPTRKPLPSAPGISKDARQQQISKLKAQRKPGSEVVISIPKEVSPGGKKFRLKGTKIEVLESTETARGVQQRWRTAGIRDTLKLHEWKKQHLAGPGPDTKTDKLEPLINLNVKKRTVSAFPNATLNPKFSSNR